jgi:hypothetical protein
VKKLTLSRDVVPNTLHCVAGLFMAISSVGLLFSLGEAAPAESTSVQLEKFDYAVPDAPAFKLLEVNPNSILRPSTRREIAVTVENANLRNFAIECAPFLLARDGKIGLKQYQSKRLLYNLRVSVGTRTPEGGASSAGIGIRMSIIDSGDPYTDQELLAAARKLAGGVQVFRDTAQEALIDSVGSAVIWGELPEEKRESLIHARTARDIRKAEEQFKAFKEDWHRDILDVALAMTGSMVDSISQPLHATAYAAWLTAGKGLGAHGQVLLGSSGRLVPNEQTGKLDSGEAGTALRFYYGSKTLKASASGDAAWKAHALPKFTGSLGTEVRLFQTIWADASVGLGTADGGGSELTSELSIRYGIMGVIPGSGILGKE